MVSMTVTTNTKASAGRLDMVSNYRRYRCDWSKKRFFSAGWFDVVVIGLFVSFAEMADWPVGSRLLSSPYWPSPLCVRPHDAVRRTSICMQGGLPLVLAIVLVCVIVFVTGTAAFKRWLRSCLVERRPGCSGARKTDGSRRRAANSASVRPSTTARPAGELLTDSSSRTRSRCRSRARSPINRSSKTLSRRLDRSESKPDETRCPTTAPASKLLPGSSTDIRFGTARAPQGAMTSLTDDVTTLTSRLAAGAAAADHETSIRCWESRKVALLESWLHHGGAAAGDVTRSLRRLTPAAESEPGTGSKRTTRRRRPLKWLKRYTISCLATVRRAVAQANCAGTAKRRA